MAGLSESHIAEAFGLFGLNGGEWRALDATYSQVYECTASGRSYILKLHESRSTDANLLLGELDWVAYLADHGVPVSRPIVSRRGRLAEAIADEAGGGAFLAACYEKAPGLPARDPSLRATAAGEAFIESWGRITGRMHALSGGYVPSSAEYRRKPWQENIDFFPLDDYPESQARVVARFRERVRAIEALPRPSGSFGMIHNDLHEDNLFVDGEKITLFDFDNACRGWFVNDLAIPLFYRVFEYATDPEKEEYARFFLGHFLVGYRREHDLPREALASLPLFLAIRELDNYSMLYGERDDEGMPAAFRRFMAGRRERIEEGRPYLDLDFASF